jgi:hypothetical protein
VEMGKKEIKKEEEDFVFNDSGKQIVWHTE